MSKQNKLSQAERQIHYQQFIEVWGEKAQLVMALEEMSELSKEIRKYLRFSDDKQKLAEIRQNIKEETADVANMISQLEFIFGEAEIEQIRDQKLQRCRDRLQNRKS